MSKLQPVRGTKDLLPDDCRRLEALLDKIKKISEAYGFETIMTPIFEFSAVFKRSLGDLSDIVSKEMYSFHDKHGDEITLRPEFTASVVRAFISNGMQQSLPLKLFSFGPLFRYERPQKGRQRQFHQCNFEVLGVPHAYADVELIAMSYRLLKAFGVTNNVTLQLNSLGDHETRLLFKQALTAFLEPYAKQLSEDSQRRLATNPLRILDSKDERDQALLQNAPIIADYYSPKTRDFLECLKDGLTGLSIPYVINYRLVRGLDYYSQTAFEFTTSDLGSQNAVIAGGRYDGLIAAMGGVETPAVGCALGVERVLLLSQLAVSKEPPIAIIPIGEAMILPALKISEILRSDFFYTESFIESSVPKRLKKADKIGAKRVILIGEDEYHAGQILVKHLAQQKEQLINQDQLLSYFHSLED